MKAVFGAAVSALVSVWIASPAHASFDREYRNWAQCLKEHVTVRGHASEVSYSKLKNKRQALDQFIQEIEGLSKAEYQSWTEPDRLSFLINVYNAFTIRMAVDHFPQKSFKDIGGLFANPWKRKDLFKLFGERVSLDLLEENWIRKVSREFDPRVNFALVNASRSAPKLLDRPYLARLLDDQLEAATREFITDRTRNGFDPNSNTFEVSQVFKWRREDFVKASGSLPKFLMKWMDLKPTPSEAAISRANVKFLSYDWALNGN